MGCLVRKADRIASRFNDVRTAIAHSIREQIDSFVRSLYLLEHVSGLPIADEDLKREFLPPLNETVRVEAAEFTPSLNQLNADEVDRNDKEREREVRRKRRQTKGRGITLPDREPVKTHRTLVPRPSTLVLQPYTDQHGNTHLPLPEMSHPYQITFPAKTQPASDSLPPPPASPSKSFSFNRDRRLGSATPQALTPRLGGGSRLKRLQTEDDFEPDNSQDGASESIPGRGVDSSARLKATSGAKDKASKAEQVAQNWEALGLHPQYIDGIWHCANW